jgi:hypothetical protein
LRLRDTRKHSAVRRFLEMIKVLSEYTTFVKSVKLRSYVPK